MTTKTENIRQDLSKALASIEDGAVMEKFLIDLCTPAELRALSERWHVAQLLDKGELSYREIYAVKKRPIHDAKTSNSSPEKRPAGR